MRIESSFCVELTDSGEMSQASGHGLLQIPAIHHQIKKTVLEKELAALKTFGRFSPIVCWMTRGPAKPMSAAGSAILRSPSMANEAVTPPVVGSVRIEI